MAGRGPAPKDPSVRARRNTKSTKTTLSRPDLRSVEDLADLTAADLRDRIDEINLERPADQQIDTRGRKAELAERIVAAESPIPPMPTHPHQLDMDPDDPPMPVEWHPQTVAWWNDQWTSPLTSGWDRSDTHNVAIIALVYDLIWTARTSSLFLKAMSEFRMQAPRLGLDPSARARLQWQMEVTDEAKSKGEKRRGKAAPAQPPAPKGKDPRNYLTAVQ